MSHENFPSAEAVKLQPAFAHSRPVEAGTSEKSFSSRCQQTGGGPVRRNHRKSILFDKDDGRRRTGDRRSLSSGVRSLSSARNARWWSQTGSNRRPPACKAGALPTELWPRSQSVRLRARALLAPVGLRPSARRPKSRTDKRTNPIRDHQWRPQVGIGGPGSTRTIDLTLIRGAL